MNWLLDRWREYGEAPALIHRGSTLTYREHLQSVSKWRQTLQARGIKRGECVAIEGDYGPEVIAVLGAAALEQAVVVPISGVTRTEAMERLSVAQVRHHLRFDGEWHYESHDRESNHPLLQQLRSTGHAGLVLFSSGSTGVSKASLLDFDQLAAKFEQRRRGYRTLVFLMFDHIGGVNTLFHVLSQGGAVITPESRKPASVCAAIATHRVQLLPTTPTFLKMLAISECHRLFDLTSLEIVTYGTEPMPDSTLTAMEAILPGVQMKQTYGLSELGIMPTKSKSSASSWLRLGNDGFEHKIVDNVLWVRSKSAMLGYLNAPSPFDEEGWMNTQDLVEVDGEYIRILGRKSEIINVGGEKVYPQEVEDVILGHPDVAAVTVFGKANPVMGKVVAARIQPINPNTERSSLKLSIIALCRSALAPFKVPMMIEFSDQDQHSSRFKKARLAQAS